MQCYKIEMADLAQEDLLDIGDYIVFKLKAPGAALNMTQGIRKVIGRLSQYPRRHEFDGDELLMEMGIRRCYYKKYKIFYMIDEPGQNVIVLRDYPKDCVNLQTDVR